MKLKIAHSGIKSVFPTVDYYKTVSEKDTLTFLYERHYDEVDLSKPENWNYEIIENNLYKRFGSNNLEDFDKYVGEE